jgi:hypothetical protein
MRRYLSPSAGEIAGWTRRSLLEPGVGARPHRAVHTEGVRAVSRCRARATDHGRLPAFLPGVRASSSGPVVRASHGRRRR